MNFKGKATLDDVARLAGVSTATVSRTLSRPDLVQRDTREKVGDAVRRLNYVPGGAARALASGRTLTIGAVVPTLDHAIFARAIQAMQTELAANGYQLLVAAHEYSPAQEAVSVRALLARGVDALMVVGADHLDETWDLLGGATVPVILSWSFDPRFASVGFDNEAAGRRVAEHLLGLGHRRFGMISGYTTSNDRARLRVAGVRAALAREGLELLESCVVQQPFTLAGGRVGMNELMGHALPPTAIIGGNDLLAVGALFEAQARGIAVPQAVSIVGIDNLEIATHVTPPMTTVHLPTAQLGRTVAAHLLAELKGMPQAKRTELPIELVVRKSTAAPAGGGDKAKEFPASAEG
ncbi:LacI family DNA-binding transcriptional regulator [Xanthobacter sp. DSM 24535]|uniref:LacI family DNA-binding transcriptional regulator n=1 Tax=Roseixanthobacter psychrophilus TaxID=3119917 RepID=UPI003728D0BE